MNVLVCYLRVPDEEYARCADAFIESYLRYNAGVEHTFLQVVKGNADVVVMPQALTRVAFHENDPGWDISSLQHICEKYKHHDYVVWLGSHARILCDGWLRKILEALRMPNTGAVGPTGSFEAGISGRHPNAHLRTNALAISPRLLNSLNFHTAGCRRDAYEFEHGLQSLYRRLGDRGLRCLVVGRDGKFYGETEWATSRTYRREEQQNLLIADKMTDMYAQADPEKRVELARMAGWDPL